jgi:hypothetical protein
MQLFIVFSLSFGLKTVNFDTCKRLKLPPKCQYFTDFKISRRKKERFLLALFPYIKSLISFSIQEEQASLNLLAAVAKTTTARLSARFFESIPYLNFF